MIGSGQRGGVLTWALLVLVSAAVLALLGQPEGASATATSAAGGAPAAQLASTPTPTYPPHHRLTGQQVRTAYGVNQLSQMGAGKIVAILDFSAPAGLQQDLCNFSLANGLPTVVLTIVHLPTHTPTATATPTTTATATAGPPPPSATPTALPCPPTPTPSAPGPPTPTPIPPVGGSETTLDVQAVHAMAPLAQKMVVVLPPGGAGALATAVTYVNRLTPGPNVVSMSISVGVPPPPPDPFSANIVYVASSGDGGHDTTNPNGGKSFPNERYPQESPNVVSVGGTTLFVTPGPIGGYFTEYAWTCPSPVHDFPGCSGGGLGATAVPTYQTAVVPTYVPTPTGVPGVPRSVQRMVPDVSIVADCASGMVIWAGGNPAPVYNCGTSLAAPLWAGVLALAVPPNTSSQQALAALYGLAQDPTAYAANFNDITNGSNGTCTSPPAPPQICRAQVGYDLVTGLGSPKANSLVPALQSILQGTPFATSTSTPGPSPLPSRTSTPTLHPLTQTAIALTGTPTPTLHPGTATAIVQTATIQALTATATPTVHPGTQTAVVQTATIQALTATATPTIHPLTATSIAATATIQALTATATHLPATQTVIALTRTSTPVLAPTQPPGGPASSGTPGVPAATAVGQTIGYSSGGSPNGVSGSWTKTGSGAFTFTATNTSAAIVPGSIPALTLPTTAGNESGTPLAGQSTVCTSVGTLAPFATNCQGTTVGDVLLGAQVTVTFATVGGGTVTSTGQQVAGTAASNLTVAQAQLQAQGTAGFQTGAAGVPCATFASPLLGQLALPGLAPTAAGQTCGVSGAVSGTLTRTGSMTFTLTATVPAGVIAGITPVAVFSTDQGLQAVVCAAAAGAAGTAYTCTGTIGGNALQGSTAALCFTAATACLLGTVSGPGAPAPLNLPPLLPPPPVLLPLPPALLPPPGPVPFLPPSGPEAAPSMPGVPVIPEADSLLLLAAGLAAVALLGRGRRPRQP